MSEQGAANMMTYSPETMMLGNSNMLMSVPQPVPPNGDGFGDGYNPWARGVPPPGAPMYQQIPPGGQMVDPNNPNSIFMQDGILYERVPVNANVSANANTKPAATPTGKPTPAATNANIAQPTPAPTSGGTTLPLKPEKTPAPTAPKPTQQPAKTPAPATEKRGQSGKEQDS
jgi:hypothetical protein